MPFFYLCGSAILVGLQAASRKGFSSLWLEYDSLILINILNNISSVPWNIYYIVRDIKSLMRDFQEMRVSHIHREGNCSADLMATWSVANKESWDFEEQMQLPTNARGALCLGKFGFLGFRKRELSDIQLWKSKKRGSVFFFFLQVGLEEGSDGKKC